MMALGGVASNGAMTGVAKHAQSAADKTEFDDAGQAIVTAPTRGGDFTLTLGVVGGAGPEFGAER
jgi:hypothetical protein